MADPGWAALSARPVASPSTARSGSRAAGRSSPARSAADRWRAGRTCASCRATPPCAFERSRSTARRWTQVAGGGRTALNLAGEAAAGLHRGVVLTSDPDVHPSDRLLVMLAAPVPDRARFRVHLGTAAAEAVVGRSGRDAD